MPKISEHFQGTLSKKIHNLSVPNKQVGAIQTNGWLIVWGLTAPSDSTSVPIKLPPKQREIGKRVRIYQQVVIK